MLLSTLRSFRVRPQHFLRQAGIFTTQHEDSGISYDVILPPEPFVFGVAHITPRTVPPHIVRPSYVTDPNSASKGYRNALIKLGSEEEEKLRVAARLAAKTRDFAGTLVRPGVTTNDIDKQVHEFILAHSAYPSPLLYSGFPRSCCTSINNIIAHGIPDDRPLQEGDIINIDVTVYLNGYHGDTSQTFRVGDVDPQAQYLLQTTTEALEEGIKACGPGKPFRGIGNSIFGFLKDKPFSVSTQFTGHGIGTAFHSTPWILHHKNDEPGVMEPGHCFTIEPAIIEGNDPAGWIFPDGWTASTENCARSAQAEQMVLITPTGAEVLTR